MSSKSRSTARRSADGAALANVVRHRYVATRFPPRSSALRERPYSARRSHLEHLGLEGPTWTTPETFSDGDALYAAVCERGLEGVVAKKLSNRYEPGERGWVKKKNPAYWRREAETEAIRAKVERRARAPI